MHKSIFDIAQYIKTSPSLIHKLGPYTCCHKEQSKDNICTANRMLSLHCIYTLGRLSLGSSMPCSSWFAPGTNAGLACWEVSLGLFLPKSLLKIVGLLGETGDLLPRILPKVSVTTCTGGKIWVSSISLPEMISRILCEFSRSLCVEAACSGSRNLHLTTACFLIFMLFWDGAVPSLQPSYHVQALQNVEQQYLSSHWHILREICSSSLELSQCKDIRIFGLLDWGLWNVLMENELTCQRMLLSPCHVRYQHNNPKPRISAALKLNLWLCERQSKHHRHTGNFLGLNGTWQL